MKKEKLREILELDLSKMNAEIVNQIRPLLAFTDNNYQVKFLAFVILQKNIDKDINLDSFDTFRKTSNLPVEILDVIGRNTKLIWSIIGKVNFNFTTEEWLAYIIKEDTSFYNRHSIIEETPNSIAKLASIILDIKPTDKVVDLCSGTGNFIFESYINSPADRYEGVEINYQLNDIAIIKSYLIDIKFKANTADALRFILEEKADKLFCQAPFGLRMYSEDVNQKFITPNIKIPEKIMKSRSTNWHFVLSMLSHMKESGKAVALMTIGSLWNFADKDFRGFLAENGLIETVITLPIKLFNYTCIQTVLVVFSHNNKAVRLIDASNCFEESRKTNIITDKHIEKICTLLNENDETSIVKDIYDISQNDYNLNPRRYLEVLPEFKDAKPFGDVIKNITRGSQIKASDLDEIKSPIPTDYRYFMLSNIKDGTINYDESQYLTEINYKLQKYCVKDKSIVIAKISSPNFKSTVVDVPQGQQILANGNLFVIEIDEEKADPYYIQSFLASEIGNNILKSICTGTVMKTISIDSLKVISIPIPSLEEQRKIGAQYAAYTDEVAFLKLQLEKTVDKMKNLFNKEVIH